MKYFDGSKLYPYIDIFSGRGCPHGCTFCLWPQVMHGHKIRLRSPEKVVDEIEHDIQLCPRVARGGEFFFEDDTFTLVKSNAIAICEEILRRGLKITFSVNARTDTADEELFKLLKRAGCRELLAGFESGDDDVLTRMKKKESVDDARIFMDLAREQSWTSTGVLSLDCRVKQSRQSKEPSNSLLNWDFIPVQFSGAVPYPGTRYFDYCKEQGLLRADRWDAWLEDGEQAAVIDYPGISKDTIKEAIDRGLKKFYFRPAYMINFLLQTRSRSDLYRKLRGAKNFFSYLLTERAKK